MDLPALWPSSWWSISAWPSVALLRWRHRAWGWIKKGQGSSGQESFSLSSPVLSSIWYLMPLTVLICTVDLPSPWPSSWWSISAWPSVALLRRRRWWGLINIGQGSSGLESFSLSSPAMSSIRYLMPILPRSPTKSVCNNKKGQGNYFLTRDRLGIFLQVGHETE